MKTKFANFKKLSYQEMKYINGGEGTCWEKMVTTGSGGDLDFEFSTCCGSYSSCNTCGTPGCTVDLLEQELPFG